MYSRRAKNKIFCGILEKGNVLAWRDDLNSGLSAGVRVDAELLLTFHTAVCSNWKWKVWRKVGRYGWERQVQMRWVGSPGSGSPATFSDLTPCHSGLSESISRPNNREMGLGWSGKDSKSFSGNSGLEKVKGITSTFDPAALQWHLQKWSGLDKRRKTNEMKCTVNTSGTRGA